MKFLMIGAVLLLAASCATTAKFQERMDRHIGQSSDQLIINLGPPQREYPLTDGRTLLEWKLHYDYAQVGGVTRENYCLVRVIVDTEGVIESYRLGGTGCFAP